MATKKKNMYQYGICTNKGKCTMADTKEVQQVPISKPFVCSNPDCGKTLIKVAPPKKGPNMIVIITAVIGILALIAGAFFLFFNGDTKEEVQDTTETIVPETIVPVSEEESEDLIPGLDDDEIEEEPSEKGINGLEPPKDEVVEESKETTGITPTTITPVEPQPTGKNYTWGTYTGDLRKGKADGVGILKYTQRHTIMRGKDYVAEPGDWVQGTFVNDEPANVTWYNKNGVEKGVIKK